MAEVLAILGAIAAGAQLTGSFIKISRSLHRCAKTIRYAKRDIAHLADEVAIFASLYDDFCSVMDPQSGNKQKQRALNRLTEWSGAALERLREVLDKAKRLAQERRPIDSFRWYLKRSLVKSLRASLKLATESMNVFLGVEIIHKLNEEIRLLESIAARAPLNVEQRQKLETLQTRVNTRSRITRATYSRLNKAEERVLQYSPDQTHDTASSLVPAPDLLFDIVQTERQVAKDVLGLSGGRPVITSRDSASEQSAMSKASSDRGQYVPVAQVRRPVNVPTTIAHFERKEESHRTRRPSAPHVTIYQRLPTEGQPRAAREPRVRAARQPNHIDPQHLRAPKHSNTSQIPPSPPLSSPSSQDPARSQPQAPTHPSVPRQTPHHHVRIEIPEQSSEHSEEETNSNLAVPRHAPTGSKGGKIVDSGERQVKPSSEIPAPTTHVEPPRLGHRSDVSYDDSYDDSYDAESSESESESGPNDTGGYDSAIPTTNGDGENGQPIIFRPVAGMTGNQPRDWKQRRTESPEG